MAAGGPTERRCSTGSSLNTPAPAVSLHYCYSLAPLSDVAMRASQLTAPGRPVVTSADVGPDLIVPWRRPSQVILYATRAIDPASLGMVDARGPHDANVILRMPADNSLFPSPALVAQVQGNEVLLADPVSRSGILRTSAGLIASRPQGGSGNGS